ncbi:hypothetical protein UFOVP181_416 [uncultured Caudovirales phage]|uniref:Uncharacterized protein n=1 Tax=uncultured Caudovirales phage TaxID=2100421 RepID=A0A6J7WHJ6_9CAUD|nr:hypothetical protein UFOVP57_223 [uncultured Caudovirales phage]CAB5209313.1 hypothetical protein UFOVP181_416 [uncultured Caudovirales phage]
MTPGNPNATQLDLDVFVTEEDTAVYVKITGFADIDEADQYADRLVDTLPLMLFETEVRH